MRTVLIAFTNIEYTIELAEGLSKVIDVILMIPEKQSQRFENVINSNLKINSFHLPRMRKISNLYFVYKLFNQIRLASIQ